MVAGASKLQGRNEIVIDAGADRIWEILEDSRSHLPHVLPIVNNVEIDGKEYLGAVRRCDVNLAGRDGHTVERCIESVPNGRLSHAIEDDSFGFSRALSDFWFSFVLEPEGPHKTRVRIETHFEPHGLKGRVMSTLMMKRKFRHVREAALSNLKRLAEAQIGSFEQPLTDAN